MAIAVDGELGRGRIAGRPVLRLVLAHELADHAARGFRESGGEGGDPPDGEHLAASADFHEELLYALAGSFHGMKLVRTM